MNQQVVCVGSIDELAELSGVRVTDLHRERCLNLVSVVILYIHFI